MNGTRHEQWGRVHADGYNNAEACSTHLSLQLVNLLCCFEFCRALAPERRLQLRALAFHSRHLSAQPPLRCRALLGAVLRELGVERPVAVLGNVQRFLGARGTRGKCIGPLFGQRCLMGRLGTQAPLQRLHVMQTLAYGALEFCLGVGQLALSRLELGKTTAQLLL